MFITALVWGLGVSIGASVGLLGFFTAFWLLEWVTGRTAAKVKQSDMVSESLAALRERNAKTEVTNDHLSAIVQAVKVLSEAKGGWE